MSVRVEREGRVGLIVLDRPPANSYDYEFLRQFGSAIDDARVGEDIGAIVVTSALDRFFSAGGRPAAVPAADPQRRAVASPPGPRVLSQKWRPPRGPPAG